MKRVIVLSLAALALVATGCGGSSSSKQSSGSSSSGSAPAATTASSGGSSASSGKAVSIDMKNIAYSPASATVKVGQKVTWRNSDTVTHNVTASSGEFQSKDFDKGGKFAFTPTKAGTINYACTLHPGMTGTLTVTQ